MLDLMEAHTFIKSIIPKIDVQSNTQTLEEKAAEDYISQTLFWWGINRIYPIIWFKETKDS